MKIIRQLSFDEVFPYIAYIPEKLSAHPALLIQLHGAGERGEGGDALEKVLVHGFSKIATDENLEDCILLMPQCPENSFWIAKIESLKCFIDSFVEKHRVDTKRIYLCGLSMGGYGTWNTAMAYPDLFAAIAPCCGGGMAWNADILKMPIWAFHGKEDSVVSVRNTIEMIEKLDGKNPYFKYTLYDGVDHDSWVRAFSPELLSWLKAQHK